MYDYLFYFFYTKNSINNDYPKKIDRLIICVGIVMAFVMHLTAVLLILIKCLFLSGYLKQNTTNLGSNLWGLVIFAILLILAFKYFNVDRTNKILEKYADSQPNTFYVVMIVFFPLLVALIFTLYFPINN